MRHDKTVDMIMLCEQKNTVGATMIWQHMVSTLETRKRDSYVKASFKSFPANDLFLYLLKISGDLWFSGDFGVKKRNQWHEIDKELKSL